ncbi:MAG TPA: alpha/beta hydrolase [Thermohalobaculum sp.]|nr:alpha/beta hydrolase [Thermohalobaculum sp.]
MTDRPNHFDPAAIAAETIAFNAALEAQLAGVQPVHAVPPELTRKARAEGRGVFPEAGPREGSEWVTIPGALGGPARVRLSLPDVEPRGTYLHIHGGGWTIGTPDLYDAHNQRIAEATGCRVASVQYRLAPEHPWPACAEDCEAAALWALEEFDDPLLIGGESAGGHLSVVTLLRLRERGRAGQVAGMVLNYGVYDLRLTPSMANWGERYLVLSTPVVDWFCGNLLPFDAKSRVDRGDPAVSPLMADLAGLVPALFQIGTCDPLVDDTLFMSQRWQAACNRAELAIYPGGVHAFDMFDLAISHASRDRQDAFVNECLQEWYATTDQIEPSTR